MTPPAPFPDDLGVLLGPAAASGRPLRVLGLFAHPDDEVFCMGGTIALAAAAGAETVVVSLTRGEAGQIRDAATATRRTLGVTRVAELEAAAAALGVDRVECLDLGDGNLIRMPYADLVDQVREILERHDPDVVVTFGDDGGFGHPDHMTSSHAVLSARQDLPRPPRVLHARFPAQDRLLLDLLVDWLASGEQRSGGSAGFGNALRLFADGSSVLGFAADHLQVQWFPAGSYVIEQGEPATELFCVLSGTVDIVVEAPDGTMIAKDSAGPGAFLGQDGLATGRPRNAHVIARDDVTCFVFSPRGRDLSAGRGVTATGPAAVEPERATSPGSEGQGGVDVSLDVGAALDQKIAGLVAHRSQYALDADLLPRQVLGPLLRTEHFTVVG